MSDGINGFEIMQAFLPYPDFEESARCLDWKRLGKQRVECYQILSVLRGRSGGWARHPAIMQWHGYEGTLCIYASCMSIEWIRRGYRDEMFQHFITVTGQFRRPPWLGDKRFHDSHKSNLLRKDPAHYGQFKWKVRADLPYVWPSKEGMM